MSEDQATPTAEQQRSAEELFELVRLLPPDEREAAIIARATDPWVQAEVRSLLRFDEPTVETLGSPRDEQFDAAKCVGLAVGGFTLRSVIGVGGMGTVFEAEQEMPVRRIAVKVLHSATARASTLARFRKESEFLARLDHPNIARVIAAGTLHLPGDATARPYFAMELVDGGRSLTRWAREERAERTAVIHTFVTACEAVGSGHRAGIVHLDLKPGNLLVSRVGALRVIDYGIARSLDATEESPEFSFAGTPQYMSPEQLTRGARVDSRADVYALGLILYELLAGRFPYDTRGESMVSIMRIVRETHPAGVRLVDATVPADLAAIVDKAIAKDPDARYGTASELADDLKRWLADEPVLAAPATLSQATLRAVRRNPVMISLAVIALAAIVTATVLATRLAIARSEDAARANRDAARANLRAASAALANGDPADALANLMHVRDAEKGWETRHLLARFANFELFSETGSESYSMREVAATQELVVGITGAFIEIIDLNGGRPTETIDLQAFLTNPQESSFPALTVSADGSIIVANLMGGSLIHYDRITSSARRLPYGAGPRAEIAGDHLVCVDMGAGVQVYDLASDRLISRIDAIGGAEDASFSANARTVVIAMGDGRLRCIDLSEDHATVTERWVTPPNPARTRAVAISPDASTIAVAWADGRIARLSVADGSTEAEQDLEGGNVFDLAISPDNSLAAASSWANHVRLIDMDSLQIRERLGGTVTHIWNIAWSADGRRLFGRIVRERTEFDDERIVADCVGAWRIARNTAIREADFGRVIAAAAADATGAQHVVVAGDGWLATLNPATGEIREIGRVQENAPAEFTAIASWRGDRDLIAIGDATGSVVLGEIDEGNFRMRARLQAVPGRLNALAFSPDGARVACGAAGADVSMIDVASAKLLWSATATDDELWPGRANVFRPIFLRGGRHVTFAGSLREARRLTFQASDGAVVAGRDAPHSQEYFDGLWHPKSEVFYMLGVTGFIACEDGVTAPEPKPLARNGGLIAADAGFTRLFVASRDGSVRVAGLDPVDPLMRLDSPAGRPVSLAFNDARDELTVITSRGVARTWCGAGVGPPPTPQPMSLGQSIRTGAIPREPDPPATQR